MNKKQLDTTGITNELTGASLFFAGEQAAKRVSKGSETALESVSPGKEPSMDATGMEHGVTAEKHPTGRDNMKSEKANSQASRQANTQAPYPASNQASLIEEIRRAVKDPGGKTTFVRLTAEEKNRLIDLVYTYKRQEVKTSENELVRIAIGYLLADYGERGKESTLARVIDALNA
jgi:hypothetical protein